MKKIYLKVAVIASLLILLAVVAFYRISPIPKSPEFTGTVVYDQATLTGSVGTPTGTVNFTLYKNDSCNLSPGQVIKTDSGVDLISGAAQSSTYKTKNGDKPSISYQAHYNGDFNYNAVDGPCESLIVN